MRYRPFNAIVTHLSGAYFRRKAVSALRQILGTFYVVDYSLNVTLGRVRDPIEAAAALRASISKGVPILRFIPVLDVRSVSVDDVKSSVLALMSSQPEGPFGIRLDGHLMEGSKMLSRRDAIVRLAEGIEREVNLDQPKVLIYIKVVKLWGRWVSAIYVGDPANIVSTVKPPRP